MHKITTSRLLLFMVLVLLVFPTLNFQQEPAQAKEPTRSIFNKPATNYENLLTTLSGSVQYTLEYKNINIWTDKTSDLSIVYGQTVGRSKKFTFHINVNEDSFYRTKLTIPFAVKNYTQIDTRFFIYFDTWSIIYDYKDIKNISGLVFASGLDSHKFFWFQIETNYKLTKSSVLVLDPIYTINADAGTDRTLDFQPAQNKIARFTNGTLFCGYYDGSIKVARSLDNGVTWNQDWFVRGETSYDSSIFATYDTVHGNTLHLAFARDVALSQGIEYMNFSTQTNTWSSIYNVTAVGSSPEEVTFCSNSSGALMFVFYDSNVSSGGHNSVFNRTFYKNVWGPMRVYDTGEATLFPTISCDYKDVWHIAACSEGANNKIFYWNITNGIKGTTRYYNGDANDQTNVFICNDGSNNTFVMWLGSIGAIYEIRLQIHWFQNDTWSHIRNISGYWTDGLYSGPRMSVMTNNTLIMLWNNPRANASLGVYYMERTSAGVYSSKHNFYSASLVDLPSMIQQAYPKVDSYYTNRPLTGFDVVFHEPAGNDLFFFNMSANYSGILAQKAITMTPIDVTGTSAHLKGKIVGTSVTDATCGFLFGTTSPTFASYDINVSCGSGFSYGDFFHYNYTTLSKATYYYVKAWIKDGTDVIQLCNETYMLTKPDDPTGLSVIGSSYGSVQLRWSNPGIPIAIDTYKAVCRYSTSSYPTIPTSGSSGFNTTQSKTATYGYGNVTGLTGGITYYFSVFLYIDDSGSPTLFKFSSAIAALATTPGGQYNITFRYENSSYHPVDFSKVSGVFNVTKTSVRTNRDYLSSYLTAEIPTSYWGSLTNPHWVYTPTFSPNSSDAPSLYAFNNSLFDWQMIKPFGYNNGTYISVGGKAGWYRIPAGTLHGDLAWSAWRLIYPSYAYSSGYTFMNVTSAYNDTTKCILEGFNTNYNSWVTIQPLGACNGTFISTNNTYRIKKGTTHGNISVYRLTYNSRESSARCKLIVHYENRSEINTFGYTNGAGTGSRIIQSSGDFNKTYRSFVLLNLSYTPTGFEFYWNDTRDIYRCYRQLVVIPPQKNYTFFVYTNKRVHGETTDFFNNTLVSYQISLLDRTGTLNLPPGNPWSVYFYFFKYDDNGSKQIIDSEYINSESIVYPMLFFGSKYYLGVGTSGFIADRFQIFTASVNTEPEIQINFFNDTITALDLSLKSGWITSAGGIYCYYIDTSSNLYASWFRVFDYYNRTVTTAVYGDSSSSSNKNYTYIGANHTRDYFISLRVNSTNGTYMYNFTIWGNNTGAKHYNGSRFNSYMTSAFGASPFRDEEKGIYIDYTTLGVAIIGIILLFSFAGIHANLAAFAAGGWFAFAGGFISGLPVLTLPLGVVFIIFGLVYSWRNNK